MNSKLLKIAILSVHSSPLGQPGIGDTGGMSIYIREITRELAKLGHTVDIFTRCQDASLPEIVNLAPGARQIHIQAGEPADLDKLLIYSHAPDVACKTENFRKLNNLQYDIIFSHYWISGISGLYLHTWWKIPHLVMFHTLGAVKNAIGIGEDEPELRVQEEALIARECQQIIASTVNERNFLKRYYNVPPEKVSIIPCGVDLSRFRTIDKQQARSELGLGNEKIILFVGRIERLKGIDCLIQSIPYLNELQPTLMIAGADGNRQGETDYLKNLALEMHVSDSVVFPGLIEYEKLPYYYNAADVCVLPSYYESFGLVPLESLACGTPVVATDVGDLQNIILEGQTGFVVPHNQPREMAEKIGLILSGKAPLLGTKDFIRQSIIRFGWQNIASSIVEVFNRVLTRFHVGEKENLGLESLSHGS